MYFISYLFRAAGHTNAHIFKRSLLRSEQRALVSMVLKRTREFPGTGRSKPVKPVKAAATGFALFTGFVWLDSEKSQPWTTRPGLFGSTAIRGPYNVG